MIPVNVEDLVAALSSAQNLYKVSFSNASNASESHGEYVLG